MITDTHYGCRNDNPHFYEYQKKFLDDVLFPYLKKNQIKHVIHLGDLVENRRTINLQTLQRLQDDFLKPLNALGIDIHIIAGNHDTYFKDTNRINSLRELVDKKYKFKIYDSTQEITIAGVKILLVPWICKENKEESLKIIEQSKAIYCMGHLELKNHEEQEGKLSHAGMDSVIFANFNSVFSGHYHHHSISGNVNYIGSAFEFTWADYSDWRGFNVLALDTGQLRSIENPYHIFCKIEYDEDNLVDISQAKNTYCRINVVNKTSEAKFQDYINSIHNQGVIDLLVDERSTKIEIQEVTSTDTTEEIFKKTILELDNVDTNALLEMFGSLYQAAKEIT